MDPDRVPQPSELEKRMTLEEFLQMLRQLTAEDLRRLVRQLSPNEAPVDELRWWQATLALDRSLRRQHLSIHASSAAHAASTAVHNVAAHASTISADQITAVAHAAADAARTYVAHDPSSDPCYFLGAWSPALDTPAWAGCGNQTAA
jgi:hypothetical protein